jgi:Uma2 family endonuclease
MIRRLSRASRPPEEGPSAMASGFALPSVFDALPPAGRSTAEDLLAPGDIGPCELVRGALVMISPAGFEHGVITQRIAAFLYAHVATRQLGVDSAAETGFLLARSPDTVRAPDVAFVAQARLPRGRTVGFFEGAPDLAIEVFSPCETRDDAARARATAKISDWLAGGCLEVWSVDPGTRTVTMHTADGSFLMAGESGSGISGSVVSGRVPSGDLISGAWTSRAVPGRSVGLTDLFGAGRV